METLELISKILIAVTMLFGAIGMIMLQARSAFSIKNEMYQQIEDVILFVFYCGCVIGISSSLTFIFLI